MLNRIKSHHRFMFGYTRALFEGFRRPAAIFLIFLSASVAAGSTVVFFALEKTSLPPIGSLLDSLYFCVSTMTGVGSANFVPGTVLGKILAMLLMLAGTALYVCFVAIIASTLTDFELLSSREQK